ncbi:hypothetical protein H5410_039487 [Solanum commersonii]|uniref:Uncharacterized protein n=1 Tax=Solanum commersonii TaxID=4109 RepID=A0A9J5XM90_SOLCO|nr:hypothetical protein H5410_039487 [Solanum commersonii]
MQQQRETMDLEIKSSPAPGEFCRAGHFELIELEHWMPPRKSINAAKADAADAQNPRAHIPSSSNTLVRNNTIFTPTPKNARVAKA